MVTENTHARYWGFPPFGDFCESQRGAPQTIPTIACNNRPPVRGSFLPCASLRESLNDRQLDAALDDSRADGVAGEAGDVVDVEFAHQMLPMFVHRFERDSQFCGDLFVGLAFGNQLE